MNINMLLVDLLVK